jgi:hypothetical protein
MVVGNVMGLILESIAAMDRQWTSRGAVAPRKTDTET